jgi:hypothetical protein
MMKDPRLLGLNPNEMEFEVLRRVKEDSGVSCWRLTHPTVGAKTWRKEYKKVVKKWKKARRAAGVPGLEKEGGTRGSLRRGHQSLYESEDESDAERRYDLDHPYGMRDQAEFEMDEVLESDDGLGFEVLEVERDLELRAEGERGYGAGYEEESDFGGEDLDDGSDADSWRSVREDRRASADDAETSDEEEFEEVRGGGHGDRGFVGVGQRGYRALGYGQGVEEEREGEDEDEEGGLVGVGQRGYLALKYGADNEGEEFEVHDVEGEVLIGKEREGEGQQQEPEEVVEGENFDEQDDGAAEARAEAEAGEEEVSLGWGTEAPSPEPRWVSREEHSDDEAEASFDDVSRTEEESGIVVSGWPAAESESDGSDADERALGGGLGREWVSADGEDGRQVGGEEGLGGGEVLVWAAAESDSGESDEEEGLGEGGLAAERRGRVNREWLSEDSDSDEEGEGRREWGLRAGSRGEEDRFGWASAQSEFGASDDGKEDDGLEELSTGNGRLPEDLADAWPSLDAHEIADGTEEERDPGLTYGAANDSDSDEEESGIDWTANVAGPSWPGAEVEDEESAFRLHARGADSEEDEPHWVGGGDVSDDPSYRVDDVSDDPSYRVDVSIGPGPEEGANEEGESDGESDVGTPEGQRAEGQQEEPSTIWVEVPSTKEKAVGRGDENAVLDVESCKEEAYLVGNWDEGESKEEPSSSYCMEEPFVDAHDEPQSFWNCRPEGPLVEAAKQDGVGNVSTNVTTATSSNGKPHIAEGTGHETMH